MGPAAGQFLFVIFLGKTSYFLIQARRQGSVTRGAEINLGGHEKFIYVNSRGARGNKKFISVRIKRKR